MQFKLISIHSDYTVENIIFKKNEWIELDTATMSNGVRLAVISGITAKDLIACDCQNNACIHETNNVLLKLIINMG